MTREVVGFTAAVNRRAAALLREMADLVERDEDVYTVDFHRETDYLYVLPGYRVVDPPPEETWVVKVKIRREYRKVLNDEDPRSRR